MEALERSVRNPFGTDGMKQLKVCRRCGHIASSRQHTCPECGDRLPRSNLFQIYQSRHHRCRMCDTVLSDSMKFCPHCGTKVLP